MGYPILCCVEGMPRIVRTTVKRLTTLLLIAALGLSVTPAPAIDLGFGLLKRRTKDREKPPESPQQTRVQQLVAILQSDPDERRRVAAAEELGQIDPRTNADVLPGLIGSLQRDPSPAVRVRTAQSIGQLKPVYQPAGLAMEAVLLSDPDAGVRDAVKSALWQYHLNGYRTPAGQPVAVQSAEPPLATRMPVRTTGPARTVPQTIADTGPFRPISNSVGKGVFYQPTAEPPLARKAPPVSKVDRAPVPTQDATTLPRPLPTSAVPDPFGSPSIPTPLPTAPESGIPVTPLPQITVPTLPQGPTIAIPPR